MLARVRGPPALREVVSAGIPIALRRALASHWRPPLANSHVIAAPNEMTWLTLQEAAKQGIEVRSFQASNAMSTPPTIKRAEPKQRAANIWEDTHGLLGTWQCSGIATVTAGYKSDQARVNGVMQITKFDGKYYWPESTAVVTPIGGAGASRLYRQTAKSKFWFEGD